MLRKKKKQQQQPVLPKALPTRQWVNVIGILLLCGCIAGMLAFVIIQLKSRQVVVPQPPPPDPSTNSTNGGSTGGSGSSPFTEFVIYTDYDPTADAWMCHENFLNVFVPRTVAKSHLSHGDATGKCPNTSNTMPPPALPANTQCRYDKTCTVAFTSPQVPSFAKPPLPPLNNYALNPTTNPLVYPSDTFNCQVDTLQYRTTAGGAWTSVMDASSVFSLSANKQQLLLTLASTATYNQYYDMLKGNQIQMNLKCAANKRPCFQFYFEGPSNYNYCNATVSPPPTEQSGTCAWYDQCGRCNGDGSTCPVYDPQAGYAAANASISQGSACTMVRYNYTINPYYAQGRTDLYLLEASGTYFPGSTDVQVYLNCPGAQSGSTILQDINKNWTIAYDFYYDTLMDGRQIYIRAMQSLVTYSQLIQCLYSSSIANPNNIVLTQIAGLLNVTSTWLPGSAYVGRTSYYAPCKVSLDTNSGLIGGSIQYGVTKLDIISRNIENTWVTAAAANSLLPSSLSSGTVGMDPSQTTQVKYDDMLMTVETCISRPNGQPVRAYAARFDYNKTDAQPPLKLVSGTPCINGYGRYTFYCCQLWQMVTQGGASKQCFSGGTRLIFDVQMNPQWNNASNSIIEQQYETTPATGSVFYIGTNGYEPQVLRPADSQSYHTAGYSIYMDNICKPTAMDDNQPANGYPVSVSMYTDVELTKSLSVFFDGDRIYTKLSIDLPSDLPCDALQLNVLKARVCVPAYGPSTIISCSDPNADIYTILDVNRTTPYYGGSYWQTTLGPMSGQNSTCSSQRVMSWIGYMLSAYQQNSNTVLEITWEYDNHISTSTVIANNQGQTSNLMVVRKAGVKRSSPRVAKRHFMGRNGRMQERLVALPEEESNDYSQQSNRRSSSLISDDLYIRCAPGKVYDAEAGKCIVPTDGVIVVGSLMSYFFSTLILVGLLACVVSCMRGAIVPSSVVTIVHTALQPPTKDSKKKKKKQEKKRHACNDEYDDNVYFLGA